MRNRFPSEGALLRAVDWLRCNEGTMGEADDCSDVADWLEAELVSRRIRGAARKHGVPADALRKLLQSRSG